MDNFQLLLLNDSNDGADWKEHRVREEQISARQNKTGLGFERLFACIDAMIKKHVRSGYISSANNGTTILQDDEV